MTTTPGDADGGTSSVPGVVTVRTLGAGASGRVVLAEHLGSGTPVAVKYLAQELRTAPGFLEDFREGLRWSIRPKRGPKYAGSSQRHP